MPQEYSTQIDDLRKRKEDIFAKGKILTFTAENAKNFYFDAVVDSTEGIYVYIVPIKQKFRYSKNSKNSINIEGKYIVNERTGDLTYIRMKYAIDDFIEGGCCSPNIEKFILGENVSINKGYNQLKNIINYKKYYSTDINGYSKLDENQKNEIEKIFNNEMNTITLNANHDNKIICLIIYAIYQIRKSSNDKILICSSSNSVADSISLELLNLRKYAINFGLLRIYAKNQEIIKRNRRLHNISFHKIVKRKYKRKFKNIEEKKNWIIRNRDIIVSTCVNSYNDDIINCKFPFVIIVDANNANENECLIPLTLKSKFVVLISFEDNDNGNDDGEINLYKRMKYLYPGINIKI